MDRFYLAHTMFTKEIFKISSDAQFQDKKLDQKMAEKEIWWFGNRINKSANVCMYEGTNC